MTTPAPVDPTRCPLCGQDNRCAMEREKATGRTQPPCWCVDTRFPPDLLQRLPPEAAGMACLCADCVRRHAESARG